jgi:hypothetical protein
MKTKDEIGKEYRLDERGIVQSPGKFEGEPWYVVALWDLVLDGCADEEIWEGDDQTSAFALDADMRAACGLSVPARDGVDWILIWERSDGFVCSRKVSNRTFLEIVRAIDEESEVQS